MKMTVNFYDFERSFVTCNRKDSFSYPALKALFGYLGDLEEDLGTEFELDPIGLCCQYTEYSSFKEVQDDYSDLNLINVDQLREKTTVIDVEGGGYIVEAF
jgi:hypothetical protein